MGRFGISYNESGDIIEIIIRDSSGGRIDKFKGRLSDLQKFIELIKRKYGIRFKREKDSDLKWLD